MPEARQGRMVIEGCTKRHTAIETARALDKKAERDQTEIQSSQIWFLVPWCRILFDEAFDDWVRSSTETHCHKIRCKN